MNVPVAERSKALFGQEGAGAAADWVESDQMAGLRQALSAEKLKCPLQREGT